MPAFFAATLDEALLGDGIAHFFDWVTWTFVCHRFFVATLIKRCLAVALHISLMEWLTHAEKWKQTQK